MNEKLYENVVRLPSPSIKAGEYDPNGISWNQYGVLLDGEDVSMSCVEANELEGWVKLIPSTRPVSNDDNEQVVTEVKYGLVQLFLRSK